MTQPEPDYDGPLLIAHRGYPFRYPENSAVGVQAAIDAGARFVEIDVQMSGDGAAVLLHDANCQRTAGVDRQVMDLPLARLKELNFNEDARLGSAYAQVSIPTLAEFVALVAGAPLDGAFVEVKQQSLERFGIPQVMDRVMTELRSDLQKFVVISFESAPLEYARSRHGAQIGWIVNAFSDDDRQRADLMAPQFVFCDHRKLPRSPQPWPGPWQWTLYSIDDPDEAIRLAGWGAGLIETNAIGELLEHPHLAGGAAAWVPRGGVTKT